MEEQFLLSIPDFPRLSDYVGAYALCPDHFRSFCNIAGSLPVMHFAKAPEPLRAVMEKVPGPGNSNIAVIHVRGLMMKAQSSMGGTSTVQVRRELRQAAADQDVSAIMLVIDSPGGSVSGTADLAADVRMARRNKPVWAFVEDLGASAAYWMASQADRIVANTDTALVGSIGTIQIVYDVSQALERDGIRTFVFTTGEHKGLGAMGRPVSEADANHMQGLINSVQASFDEAVMKGRSMNKTQLQAVRHGGVITAPAAMEAKLIDAIQPLGKTLADLGSEIKGRMSDARRAEHPLPMPRRLPMRA